MDPISALGIASSVITFIDFATKIIATSKEIYDSEAAATFENTCLGDVYEKLHELSSRLESPSNGLSGPQEQAGLLRNTQDAVDVSELQGVAKKCKLDCEVLLQELGRYKAKSPKSKLGGAIKSALRIQLGKNNIADMKERLKYSQGIMSIQIDTIICSQISNIHKILESLSLESYQLKTDQKLNMTTISTALEDISKRLDKLKLEELEQKDKPDPYRRSRASVFSNDHMQAFIESVMEVRSTKKIVKTENAIIKTLRYDSWHIRQESICEAHRKTFKWAFESKVASWLDSGDGIFWVSGKPGSGKSTLIKFIAGHRNTKRHLAKWAQTRAVVTATHFFWAAGTPMQKSLHGLYRSLLYDITRKLPSCIPVAFPERWATALHTSLDRLSDVDNPWSLTELSIALRNLAKSDELTAAVCIFVDGMDEFDGDMLDLCEILEAFSQSHRMKLCLSSRPWNVFKDCFGSEPAKLIYLHELTHGDIRQFAQDQLQSHPRWLTSTSETSMVAKHGLIEEVATRAEGVFLWAFLVTRSLREGLSNDDTIKDMQKRLESLPRSLEDLFRHILETVDPIYHAKMAGMFKVTAHAVRPLLLDLYWHYETGFGDMQYAIVCPTAPHSQEKSLKQREQASRRINAMTKGLLEVRTGHVEFLHRTVKDYLGTKEGSEYINQRSQSKHSTWLSILMLYLAYMKSTRYETTDLAGIVRHAPGQNTGQYIQDLHEALVYADLAAKVPDDASQVEICLDEYEKSTSYMQKTSQVTVDALTSYDRRQPFREEMLKHDLSLYLEKKLADDPNYFDIFDRSPLYAALMPIVPYPYLERPDPSVRMVEIILQHGIDPNEPMASTRNYKPSSPYEMFIQGLSNRQVEHVGSLDTLRALLLSYGTSPQLGKQKGSKRKRGQKLI
ncbi:hypothetical protein FSARC_12345 [Fusarium sarcochroum]|uniref:NACHT domain-containing protein n=1 Tax=Fusarium sarcochroum TaxID=1208366 RepID=A0A8H4WXI8_9HYPO|nr:hypothetical protein FSARC_12345 [Fusarium sarcochroum]